MSKIICDICGTSYPDTAEQCPTCGFEKPVTADFIESDAAELDETPAAPAHEAVKGGRFSKGNVRKRTKPSVKKAASKAPPVRKPSSQKKNERSDRVLIIAIALLLVGILLVGAYIYINFFMPKGKPEQTEPSGNTSQTTTADTTPPITTQPIVDTQPVDLSCTGLTLSETSIVLNAAGNSWILNAVPTPANTTDSITYISLDTNVATVDETGKVTAVGNGETEINVVCGNLVVTCTVKCELAPPPETQPQETQPAETQPNETQPAETQPNETQPEETQPDETQPQGDFKFNTKYGDEVSMKVGDSWTAYVGDIDPEDIQWSVGNSSVATVKNGKVKAVGAGMTTLRAVYNGVEYKCLIRCEG